MRIAVAWKNKARIFDRYQRLDSMAYYYRLAYKTACASQDTFMANHLLNEYISAYMDHGMVEEGAALIHLLPEEIREKNPIGQYSLGMTYLRWEKPDSARLCFQNALRQIHEDYFILRRDLYRLLSELAERQGDMRQALRYARESSALKDSIAERMRTEALQKIHSLYNYQHIEEENSRLAVKAAQTEKWVYRSVCVILVLTIYVWFHTPEHWDAIRENSPQWKELEERVNEVYPGVSQTLLRHYPKIKTSELHVCLLVKIGISVSGMARIMDLTKSAISNIRTRLYEKIFEDKGSTDDFDKFILGL